MLGSWTWCASLLTVHGDAPSRFAAFPTFTNVCSMTEYLKPLVLFTQRRGDNHPCVEHPSGDSHLGYDAASRRSAGKDSAQGNGRRKPAGSVPCTIETGAWQLCRFGWACRCPDELCRAAVPIGMLGRRSYGQVMVDEARRGSCVKMAVSSSRSSALGSSPS